MEFGSTKLGDIASIPMERFLPSSEARENMDEMTLGMTRTIEKLRAAFGHPGTLT